jgi:hypothetical protein
MIIQMAICFPLPLKTTNVLEQLATFGALEASWMPSQIHGAYYPANHSLIAVCASDGIRGGYRLRRYRDSRRLGQRNTSFVFRFGFGEVE